MKGGDKMDNKTLWTVIVTALIVAVLTSLITVKLTGNIVNIPTVYPSPTNYTSVYTKAEVDSKFVNVRANSCDADGVCETINLVAKNTSILSNVFALSVDTINLWARFLNSVQVITTDYLTTYKGLTSYYNSTLYVQNLTKGPPIRPEQGSRFVCVDWKGLLYGSDTPCR